METLPRRRYLALAVGGLSLSVAGCTADEEPEFLVTNTEVIHQDGFGYVDYTHPDDMLVRVTVENEFAERREGVVVVELVYAPDGDPIESWEQREELSLGRTQSPQQFYVFRDAYQEGSSVNDYRADGYIEPTDN